MRFGFLVGALGFQVFLALSPARASAACLTPPLSPQAIAEFKSHPQSLVAPGSDTRTIEATTRDLAGTDASLSAELVHLAEGTSPRFQTAIAAGLAQAATACASVDQQASLLIQQAVAGFQDGQFQASFAAVAGDLSTAATAAAAAFASSSAGSVVVINPNPPSKSGGLASGGGATTTQVLTSAVLSINTSSTTTGIAATAAQPVSSIR